MDERASESENAALILMGKKDNYMVPMGWLVDPRSTPYGRVWTLWEEIHHFEFYIPFEYRVWFWCCRMARGFFQAILRVLHCL